MIFFFPSGLSSLSQTCHPFTLVVLFIGNAGLVCVRTVVTSTAGCVEPTFSAASGCLLGCFQIKKHSIFLTAKNHLVIGSH